MLTLYEQFFIKTLHQEEKLIAGPNLLFQLAIDPPNTPHKFHISRVLPTMDQMNAK
jgi:hypothetical protein